MRHPSFLALLLLALALPLAAAGAEVPGTWNPPDGFWATPTIPGCGRIHDMPRSAYHPKPDQSYKIVFSLTKPMSKPEEVNSSLDHLARAVNLYVAAGVPLERLHFVGIIYGPATDLVMDNAHYRARHGVDNPNLPLIKLLRERGIDVAVCDQAVAEHHIAYDWVDKNVTQALSGITTVTVLEHEGYTLMPL